MLLLAFQHLTATTELLRASRLDPSRASTRAKLRGATIDAKRTTNTGAGGALSYYIWACAVLGLQVSSKKLFWGGLQMVTGSKYLLRIWLKPLGLAILVPQKGSQDWSHDGTV